MIERNWTSSIGNKQAKPFKYFFLETIQNSVAIHYSTLFLIEELVF